MLIFYRTNLRHIMSLIRKTTIAEETSNPEFNKLSPREKSRYLRRNTSSESFRYAIEIFDFKKEAVFMASRDLKDL